MIVRFLSISGSLRATSSNTNLLRALADLAPKDIFIEPYLGLGDLPHFNPDLDGEDIGVVTDWRKRLNLADGVLISSPEYAHGVPGVLKNALDWVVGSGELVEKPVALFNASPRAIHAQASLVEILTTMSAKLVMEASIAVPLLGRASNPADILAEPEIAEAVRAALITFERAVRSIKKQAQE